MNIDNSIIVIHFYQPRCFFLTISGMKHIFINFNAIVKSRRSGACRGPDNL
jgi:hypothetical protein